MLSPFQKLAVLLLSLFALSAAWADSGLDVREARDALAPTGVLRVGVYRGSPSSFVQGATPAEAKGVGYDLGKELAHRLDVPFQPMIFASNDEIFAAMKKGEVDITFTNASPERKAFLDFSPTYMNVEKSMLVPAGSPLKTLDDFRKPGVTVGASRGSSTKEELLPLYPDLRIETVPTLGDAQRLLAAHQLDAFATNKAILFEISDHLPGSTVIPGHWGMEHFGAGIPKDHHRGLPYLDSFVQDALASGLVKKVILHAGLRGTVDATVQ